jgi:cytochrome c553
MGRLRTLPPRRGWATLVIAGAALVLLAAQASDEGEEAKPAKLAASELAQALELPPDIDNGLTIYRICAECHQPEGWGLANGSYPQLAGQHRKVIIKQLAEIRACLRDNPEMYPRASPETIGGAQVVADVAGYIDTLEISVATGKGPGEGLEGAAALYADKCARCHGASGEGDNDEYIPRIQSQHYAYLQRQFRAIRSRERGNADPEMLDHAQGIEDAAADALLDYVSRLEPPKEFQAPPGWSNPDFPK